MLAPKTDFALFNRMLNYLKPYKVRFLIAILASLPVAAIQGVAAWLIGPFTDQLLKHQNFNMLIIVPVLLLGATIIQGVCQYLNEYCTSYVGQSISQTMRTELFTKLNKMEKIYFNRHSASELLTRYCVDPAQLQSAINDNLQDFIVKTVTIIGLAAVLLFRNWAYAIVSLFIISLTVLPIGIISKKVRRMDHTTRAITSRLFEIFTETCMGYKVIKVFQLEKHQEQRYQHALKDYFSATMRITKATVILKPLMQFITAAGVSVVFIIGIFQIQNKQMTPGDLTSFIVALVLLIQPIKTVGSVISKMQRILAPAERVFEKMDIEPDLKEPENATQIGHFESLEFRSINFEYETGKPILKNINLLVQAGETVAFVGPSGSGKSTLLDLIPRFMDPTNGQILMNTVDLRNLSLAQLRSKIAIVSQEPIIFEGTIKENIMLGKANATENDLRYVLTQACLDEWVDSLEQGWDTELGSAGSRVSGGQKQRIAIARAFLKDAPILILDEATSALDTQSEAIVQQALNQLIKGRTVFIVAHRLSTVQKADRIIVINKGEIAEIGTHVDLLHAGGVYSQLYSVQAVS